MLLAGRACADLTDAVRQQYGPKFGHNCVGPFALVKFEEFPSSELNRGLGGKRGLDGDGCNLYRSPGSR